MVTLTFDLWPQPSNSGEIFVQRTQLPSLIVLSLVVRKLSCGQTDKHTSKETDKQTDAAENIHLASLRYLRRWLINVQSACSMPCIAGCDASLSDFHGNAVSEEVYADRGKLVYGKQYRVVDLPGVWVAGKHSALHWLSTLSRWMYTFLFYVYNVHSLHAVFVR